MNLSIPKMYYCLLLLLAACQNNKPINREDTKLKPVIIAGHFENVADIDSLSNIGIYARDYVTQETFTTERILDSSKQFKFKFEISKQQDIMVLHNTILSIIVKPGDSIYLIMDGSAKTYRDIHKNLKISGSSAQINQNLMQYFVNKPIDYHAYGEKKNTLSEYTFKKYKDSLYAEQSKYIDNFLQNNNFGTPLSNWLEAEKLYGLAASYNFTNISNEKIAFIEKIENDLPNKKDLDFRDVFYIKSLPKIKTEHLINTKISNKISSDIRDYYSLKHLDSTYRFKENWQIKTINQSLEENPDNPLLSKLVANQIIQTSFNNSDVEVYEDNRSFIESLLKGTFYKDNIKKKYTEVIELLKNPVANKNIRTVNFQSESASDLINKIIDGAEGKVIYIDHWATWCAPCINEFEENTPNFVKRFSKDVEFVYLCHKSNRPQWKAMISKFQLEGEHYFIEENIVGEISDVFSIKGYPTYTIINKKGEIIESNESYKPGREQTIKLIEELIQ